MFSPPPSCYYRSSSFGALLIRDWLSAQMAFSYFFFLFTPANLGRWDGWWYGIGCCLKHVVQDLDKVGNFSHPQTSTGDTKTCDRKLRRLLLSALLSPSCHRACNCSLPIGYGLWYTLGCCLVTGLVKYILRYSTVGVLDQWQEWIEALIAFPGVLGL